MSTVSLRGLLLSTASVALIAGGATAQQPAASVPTQLDAITVTADREAKPVGETTGVVDIIDGDEIEKRGVQRLQDLPRYEPGVTVTNSTLRSGAGGFAIRGITNNRILMQVDGTRLPETPASASPSAGYSRDVVDLDSLKQVEILRGPASALYGSDALGGVVSYVTKDPEDYLTDPNKNIFASLKTAYSSMDSSFSETGTFAARSGNFSGLALYTRRDGEELNTPGKDYNGVGAANNGRGLATRNPQDYGGNNFLGKGVWDNGTDRIALTGEYFTRNTDTDLRSDITAPTPALTMLDSQSEDKAKRYRLSLGHTHTGELLFLDKLDWKVYYTNFERTEHRTQLRDQGADNFLRTAHNSSEQNIIGGEIFGQTKFDAFNQVLTYGVNADFTKTERLRDATSLNLTTGVVSNVVAGEAYPNRTFPNTETLKVGSFFQYEGKFGPVTVVPGVRADYYNMNPKIDAEFQASNPPSNPKTVSELAVSPKLGATVDLTDQFSLFGQYAHGFRAPPYDDAALSFTNPTMGYMVIPNNDLKPETSDGVEVGFRGKFNNGSSFQVSSFYNRYKNFISQEFVGIDAGSGLQTFQSQNLSKVVIYGAEAKGDWRFLPSWALQGGAAWAMGFDKETDTRLDSVAPVTLTSALSYNSADELWGAQIAATHVRGMKHADGVANFFGGTDPGFQAKSYTTVDLAAYYNPFEFLTLTAAVNNLFDEKYYNYINVNGLADSSTVKDRFLEAGRSVTVSATVKW
ncbi:TonB-dependent hemoglobin/transferrin/lactoferrin family receptor [Lacibacterium aquatile]|uniref:TonB-dependent hemoglobin/transferrin/lactoferrin family receptor n=1 Tax=Lacibacterium aquatile TaxID=1168082 RepID=A0ABW5DLF2_9PROT